MKSQKESRITNGYPQEKPEVHVLLIEDDKHDAYLVQELLRDSPFAYYTIEWQDRLTSGITFLEKNSVDIILLDLHLSDSKGIDTFTRIHSRFNDTPIIVLTGMEEISLALDIVEMGARDYLMKSEVTASFLSRVIRYALEKKAVYSKTQQNLNKRFQALIENGDEAITLLDPDGMIQYVSPAAERIIGYPLHELNGQHYFSILHPEDIGFVTETMNQLVKYPYAKVRFQFRILHKNGSTIRINAFGHNLLRASSVQSIIVSFKSVRENQAIDENDAYRQLMVNTLLEHSPLMLFCKDSDCRYKFLNNTMAQMLGTVSPGNVIGKTDFDFLLRERASEIYSEEKKIMSSGAPVVGRVECVRLPSGELRLFSITKFPIRNQYDSIIGVAGMINDVSEIALHSKTEEPLDQISEKAAPGNSPAIWVCDLQSLSILETNDSAARQFGYTREEFLQQKLNGIYPAAEIKRLQNLLAKSSIESYNFGFANQIRKDGSRFTAETFVRPLQYHGKPAVCFIANSNIPEASTMRTEQLSQLRGDESILLIEDEPILRDLITTVLEEQGYAVLTASDGKEGVSKFQQHCASIKLVITDLGLPKLDGAGVLQEIRRMNPTVKAMFTTGYINNHVKKELVSLGATEFVLKPFLSEELLTTVRKALDNK